MAEFNLASLLANAAQTNADFDFGKLNKSYYQGLDEAYKKRTRDAFMGPDVLTNGRIDPDKLLQKATKVGGLPAAEQLQSLFNTGQLQERFEAGKETQRGRGFTNPPADTPASPSSFPPSPSRDPAVVTEPKAPKTAPARQPPLQPQVVGPFTQFLTAQGIPADQQQNEAIKLQQSFMQRTGRPFDTSKQLNLADNDTRQVLGSYVLSRAQQGQQPQAEMATRIGPQGGTDAMAQQSPFMPQTGPQVPLPPTPPSQAPVPQQQQPPAQPPPQQQPMVPRPVQTVPVQRPVAVDPVDQTMNAIVGPRELQRFGTWQNALAYYESRLGVASGLPPAQQADLEKKVAAMRDQLKITETQRNAAAAGQSVRQFLDQPEEAKQNLAVLEKTYPVVIDGQKEAKGLRDGVVSLLQARQQLDAPGGTVTGVWANERLKALRIAALAGADVSRISNTETFNSEMSRRIQQMAASLPGQLSDKDVKFLSSIGGTSELNERTLRTMLDVAEDYARKKIRSHNEQVTELAKTNDAAARMKTFLSVNEPEPYRRQLHEGDLVRNKSTGKIEKVIGGKLVPQ